MSRVSTTSIPKGAHADLRRRHGCQRFKALFAMFLASGLDIFSHAAFTKGSSNLGMIGITAAKCFTILHMLSSIKKQVRVTNFTLSLRPRESIVSIAAKAGDSTICTKMQTDNFSSIGNRLGSFHDKGWRKCRDLCCPYHYRWLSSNLKRPHERLERREVDLVLVGLKWVKQEIVKESIRVKGDREERRDEARGPISVFFSARENSGMDFVRPTGDHEKRWYKNASHKR